MADQRRGPELTGLQKSQGFAPGAGHGCEGAMDLHLLDADLFKIPQHGLAEKTDLHIATPVPHQVQSRLRARPCARAFERDICADAFGTLCNSLLKVIIAAIRVASAPSRCAEPSAPRRCRFR